jgi:S-DNA-T family DNA segregation ATPase FtsK/SpoIIIE
MTVNNEPLISRSLALLEKYRHAAALCAEQEEQLTLDIGKRRYAAERKEVNANKESVTRQTKEVAQADREWAGRMDGIHQRGARQRTRLERAERNARRELPKRVEARRGDWLGALQRQKLKLEKEVTGKLTLASAEHMDLTRKLEEQRARINDLTAKARRAVRGSLGAFLSLSQSPAIPPLNGGTAEVDAKLLVAHESLESLRGNGAAKIASLLPVWITAPVIAVMSVVLIFGLGSDAGMVGGIAGVLLLAVLGLHFAAAPALKQAAQEIGTHLAEARTLRSTLAGAAEAAHAEATHAAQERQQIEAAAIKEQWAKVGDVGVQFLTLAKEKLNTQVVRIAAKQDAWIEARKAECEAGHTAAVAALQAADRARQEHHAAEHRQERTALDTEEAQRWEALQSNWKRESTAIWQELTALGTAAERHSHSWDAAFVERWKPAVEFDPLAEFAHLDVDLAKHAGALPKDPRLPLPGPVTFTVPLALTFPQEGSLLFETSEAAAAGAAGTLNHLVLRLLATTPPGRTAFTVFDPASLGAGFAGLMHLADYEEAVINRRIWTQRDHIEERLVELGDHVEKVIQMYLRNDYATIADYNAQAGSIAEKYHFVVAADFPSGFSDVAVKRLLSLAVSGPRCGVYTFIHWDQRLPQPDGFVAAELRRNSLRIMREDGQFILADGPKGPGLTLRLDPPPDAALGLDLVHRIGKASVDSSRVQVPFSQIAPPPGELWTGDTTNELRVAVGRTGATKHQMLAIGKGTRQHALVAGKTGSGKSTLFHVMITNLALWHSPDEVEFYLIDFKKGVEFKCYATFRLPHARVVAIESDREFALSVLQRVDEELKRRGDLFRKLGVQDVAGFRRESPATPLPRTLLLIDEFQEFFVEDDSIAQTASLLFDRIVRQGRAFGIHVVLGSQTLGGAYSLARATLGQMVIRIALQCNEADAYLIMDDSNSAPRLLSRPGEGIYNDAAGAVEGNSPFQVVWINEDERDECLERIQKLEEASGRKHGAPLVFEGNAPSDVTENELLATALRSTPPKAPPAGRMWLGAPNAIKGPTEAAFYRQSGNHLLICGQRDEVALTMLALGARALAAQYPPGTAKFYFIHSAPPGTADAEFIEMMGRHIPHGYTEVRTQDVPRVIDELATECKARSSGEIQADTAPAIYIFIHQLHRFKKLRQEDDFRFGSDDGPADTGAQFNEIITEGSSLGIHLIPTVDTFNNVGRSMSRKALSEFEMRVVFQMSANDSSSLIDTPGASSLGLHRAIFYNEQSGVLETFRPYAAPAENWWAT